MVHTGGAWQNARVYRGRFAPSPTGKLHLGHARTFLVAWLRARRAGGSIVMRIEDLDAPRVVEGAAEAICEDLLWLGLDWDEGPIYQSSRFDRYEHALETLRDRGRVYPCSCTRKEIAAIASAPHGPDELGPRYPNTCRGGPAHPDRPCSVRFRMPDPPPAFVDRLHGAIDTSAHGGDFVVRRADGIWAYQLAVVVDDAEMGVTEVVRGDDLISSTSRQLALFEALGHAPPAFLHVPLILGPDGERLSKRHGATAIADHRAAGRRPEEVLGLLAGTLGLPRPSRPEDLLDAFDPHALAPRPATLEHIPHLPTKE